ncbi:glycosyl hydrolase family 92-domain-containing protein [Bisporella sp. PMI_857]|nr:glycosyl hydrolase family 92-domain-containing protein [Bisporella sp. PMI_857]
MRLHSQIFKMASHCAKAAVLLVLIDQSTSQDNSNLLTFINPLIGTMRGGNAFPGATLPSGMAKAVADTASHNQGGFGSDASDITGFSHMHDSGTGGAPSLGIFPFFPYPGYPDGNVTNCAFTGTARTFLAIVGSAESSPGYFAVTLKSQIHAEMTVTRNTVLYRFKMKTPPANSLISVEAENLGGARISTTLNVSPENNITVVVSFQASFGSESYEAYICASFHAGEILLGVGMSLISQDRACSNAADEVPDFDFERVVSYAMAAWREKLEVNPLWTRMVRSLVGIYRNTGYLPDCRMTLCKVSTGRHRLCAVVTDAEVEPYYGHIGGPGHVEYWKTIGYVPRGQASTKGQDALTSSVSRSKARELGYDGSYAKHLNKSGNWTNLLRKNQTSFIGTQDIGFDTIQCSPLKGFDECYLTKTKQGGEIYEASIWLYTFFVPGDTVSLILVLGEIEEFVRCLDFLRNSGLLYIGNEPVFLTFFQYYYTGRPGLSVARARAIIPSQFNDTLGGLPGNDDSAAMGSFAVFIILGNFPNARQDVYFIAPLFFRSVNITSKITGATIRNVNFSSEGTNIYVQAATLNGKTYTKNWLQRSFFLEGGTLELTLGSEKSDWGTGPEDVPPFNGSVTLPIVL